MKKFLSFFNPCRGKEACPLPSIQNTEKQSNLSPKDIIEQILSGKAEYQENYDGAQAMSALKDQPVGTYLLRGSSLNKNLSVSETNQARFIALSYMGEPSQVLHTLIVFLYADQRFYLATNSSDGKAVADFIEDAHHFADMEAAIQKYQKLNKLSFALSPWKKSHEANSEGAYLECPELPNRTPSVRWP